MVHLRRVQVKFVRPGPRLKVMMILLVWQPIGWISYKQSTVYSEGYGAVLFLG